MGIRSADNPDTLRGEGLDLVIMDECAYMVKETWTEVIRPALSDKEGSALFISTPRGRNWFWTAKRELKDKNWRNFTFTSYDNYINPRKLTMLRKIFQN